MVRVSYRRATLPFLWGWLAYGVVSASQTQKPLGGGKKANPLTKKGFGKHVNELLEKWRVPGVAIGVVDGDEIWTEGYGLATLPDTPVTPSTLFYGASTSKAFTAATLAIMIESGNYTSPAFPNQPLDWKTPISDILRDDFVLSDDWATAHITIEDALSHRTGMPRHDLMSPHIVDGRNATVKDVVRLLRHLPLTAEPRTKWQYCNHMYITAAHIVETLTGRWMGDVLDQLIWQPLGMTSTYFSTDHAIAAPEHFAAGYAWDQKSGEYARVPYMPTDEVSGAGAVISNVIDYSKWLHMLLREAPPVPEAGHRAFKTPRMFIQPDKAVLTEQPGEKGPFDMPEAYGFGWEMASYRGHRFWTHNGGMHAYGAEVYFFPDLAFGAVVFGNTAVSSNSIGTEIIWGLVDDKLDIPDEDRYDWVSRYARWEKKEKQRIDGAIDKYYPNRPTPTALPSLPIKAYVGTYLHPGYGNMTLEPADPEAASRPGIQLVVRRTNMTWPWIGEFEHVSGEFWMIYSHLAISASPAMNDYAPAQFQIGPDGKVASLGVTFLAQDAVQGLIWFDRQD